MISPTTARADSFNASLLIGDGAFVNTDAMSVSDIQDFLNRQGGFLAGYSESGRSAAQIIYDAAHGYGDASGSISGITINSSTGTVNPQILLATLQKEQSLITMTSQNDAALRTAMGYGCPDSGGCNSAYAGFIKQVENAAWQFRYNYERAQGHGFGDYQVGQSFCFDDSGSGHGTDCGTYNNRSTASLYRYTPHVYNGNSNFVQYFNQWFITPVWGATEVNQTATEHPGRFDVAFGPGETRTVTVVMKNTGQETWLNSGVNTVHLGTADSHDRRSPFLRDPQRAASMIESSVAPGNNGTFVFTLTAPNTPTTLNEHFQLVAEGKAWFGQTIGFVIYVAAPGATVAGQYQSEHPGFADVAFGPGETRTVSVSMRNTGDSTWFRTGQYPVYLGTANPSDRKSPFLSTTRILMDQSVVIPGQTGTFTFTMTDPGAGNGSIMTEQYQLVQERVAWFGPVATFKIYNARVGAAYITQGPHVAADADLQLAPGQSGTLTLQLRNNSDATWFKGGTYPLNLGTAQPHDRRSAFLSDVRVSLDQAVVVPGQTGTFTIHLTAPSTPGTYVEHFQPVMDFVTWFGPDVSWTIKVQ